MTQKHIILALIILIIIVACCYYYSQYIASKTEHEHPGHGVAGQFGLRDFRVYEDMCGRKEHQHPGHGVAGQFGLRDFKTYENFYSSGSSQRYKTEADTSTELTIPNKDFNIKELSYYMRR